MPSKKKLPPQKKVINLQIEEIEDEYFSEEKNLAKKRGKAFQYLCLSTLCDLDLNEIEEEDIIDGGDDEGIDIIHLDELPNNAVVNIFNCNSSKTENYSANDLIKLQKGLEYIFEEEKKIYQKLKNHKLVAEIANIRLKKQNINRINIYYCVFNGDKSGETEERKKEEIIKRLETILKSQYRKADLRFYFVGSNELHEKQIKNEEPLKGIKVKIPYFDKGKKFRSEVTPRKGLDGYVTTFNAQDIVVLVEKHQENLFEKNIRGWLKYNKKNKDIYNSCIGDESSNFWFLNNGITIIADEVFPDDDKERWEITNMQIINGQQTAWALYDAYKNRRIKKDVKLMCRIYQTKDPVLINKIAKATNTQSSIGSRDLMSNDPKQIAIEKVFRKLGYFYERQRGQKRLKKDEDIKKFKGAITSKKLAQVGLAILCGKPSLARKNIEDNFFNKDKYYNNIFDHDPKELLLAYFVFKYCEKKAKENEEKDQLKYFGALHIARIIWESKKKLKKRKIGLGIEYNKAYKLLKTILKDKEKKIENLGHYLSRVEVDELIFEKLSKTK